LGLKVGIAQKAVANRNRTTAALAQRTVKMIHGELVIPRWESGGTEGGHRRNPVKTGLSYALKMGRMGKGWVEKKGKRKDLQSPLPSTQSLRITSFKSAKREGGGQGKRKISKSSTLNREDPGGGEGGQGFP